MQDYAHASYIDRLRETDFDRSRWRACYTVRVALLVAAIASFPGAFVAADPGRPHVSTLEDIYGPSGERFAFAIGIRNEEKDGPNDPDPQTGFGLAVDDVVMKWREFSLVEDAVDCGAVGQCAVLDAATSTVFGGRDQIELMLLESTPDAANDCDLDGTADGTADCDGDGVPDLVVRVFSSADPVGEVVFVNCTDATGPGASDCTSQEYRGTLSYSTLSNVPGLLTVASDGSGTALATAEYRDNDDGTGSLCQNSVNPAAQGLVRTTTTVFIATANVLVINPIIEDGTVPGTFGDGDGFADTHETVQMRIRVANKDQTRTFTNVSALLTTGDPKIECVQVSSIALPDLAPGAAVESTDGFKFKVADVDRAALGLSDLDTFAATFNVLLFAAEFDAPVSPDSGRITLDLDLDVTGGSPTPTTFFEGFESGTFGAFTTMNLDAGRNNLLASDGYRCQYHDPDWINSNSYGVITDCFLGATPAQVDAYYWKVHQPTAIDNGKAFSGTRSLYMGIFGPAADEHTTPMGTLEAIRLDLPINLGFVGSPPELSFKHQVSLMDSRSVGTGGIRRSADAAAVMLQLPTGSWISLEPYVNVYAQQRADNFFQCMFDPVDDGSVEDTFCQPDDVDCDGDLITDPGRRIGRSTLCHREFTWARQGETLQPFSENNLGFASDGPGLQGSLGKGTWVEARFDLSRFKGRRVRFRFITSGIKVGRFETYEQLFSFNPDSSDDGWWIDDVTVTNTVADPTEVTVDIKDNSGLPGCGAVCGGFLGGGPRLSADPPVLVAPGQPVELSAGESQTDACLSGILQFQFWVDGNGDGLGGDAQDRLLRAWSDNPRIVQAPKNDTTYVVDGRCSSAPFPSPCNVSSTSLAVDVNCPTDGRYGFPTVLAPSQTTLEWGAALTYDFALGFLADIAGYTATSSGTGQGPAATFGTGAFNPSPGSGYWFLFRETGSLGAGGSGLCNDPGITWGNAGRDGVLP